MQSCRAQQDARRVVPMALFLGLLISGGLTCVAGFALVGCVRAQQLDPAAGFVSAFELLGLGPAAQLDGFLPAPLARKDPRGEPLAATLLGGAITAICAAVVPFEDHWQKRFHTTGVKDAELRSLLGSFVCCGFGSLLLLSPRWTSDAALAPTLLTATGAHGAAETVAWPLTLAAAVFAMKIQQKTVQATERRRAQRAAALGRATKEAQALVQQRHEHEEQAPAM
eukprot:Skav209727  [mRNA]  locus=scaffold528:488188:497462:- [translate_table: standard]